MRKISLFHWDLWYPKERKRGSKRILTALVKFNDDWRELRVGNEILIGDRLRQARLKKNISLDELQQKSKIQKRYLEAIEKGAFHLLPGEYYVRTFLRQYAEVVGEDGNQLVAIYEGEATFGEPLPRRARPEVIEGSRAKLHTQTTKDWMNYLPTILLGLIGLGIIGIVVYSSMQDKNKPPMIEQNSMAVVNRISSSSTSESRSTTTVESSTTTSSTSKKPEMTLVLTPNPSNQNQINVDVKEATDPITFTFTGVSDRCWIGVYVDGQEIFQYAFSQGEEKTYSLPAGTTQAQIIIGASKNMGIAMNGQALEFNQEDALPIRKELHFSIAYQTNA